MTTPRKALLVASSIFVLSVAFFPKSFSQDRKGFTGIGVQISTPPVYNLLFSGGNSTMEMQPDVLVSAWVTDNIAIEPSVGILAYTNETFWRLGFAVVNHFGQEKLSPFVLFRAKTYLYSTSGWESNDYLFGLAVGGEYFVGEKFSVSGGVQLNYAVPDKEQTLFVRRNTIMTGVGIGLRFYLN